MWVRPLWFSAPHIIYTVVLYVIRPSIVLFSYSSFGCKIVLINQFSSTNPTPNSNPNRAGQGGIAEGGIVQGVLSTSRGQVVSDGILDQRKLCYISISQFTQQHCWLK